MQYKDRDGNLLSGNDGQEKVIRSLYGNVFGRSILKLLTLPTVSKIGGKFLDTRLSAAFISGFVKKSGICLKDYEPKKYRSYNDFFTRRIKRGKRPFAQEKEILAAPCDSKLSVEKILPDGRFFIKNTPYTMASLLRSRKLAKRYYGGVLLIFRLTVDDYHHYAYIDDGVKSKNYRIPGVLHTVNPIAGEIYPIYAENTREFSILKSDNFGDVLMMEVGALMVGKIVNLHEACLVRRGVEKGYFEFGGSTVILAFEKNRVKIDPDILENMLQGVETVVKQGERIGRRASTIS